MQGRVADTAIVEFKDGSKWVRKTFKPSKMSRANDPDREELAYHISNALGAEAPAVIRTSPEEFWMPFVEAKVAGDFPASRTDPAFPDPYVNTDRGLRIGMLDYVTSNVDRHIGNWMIAPDGQPIPIDHGRAWYWDEISQEMQKKYPYHVRFYQGVVKTPNRLRSLSLDEWNTMQQKLDALKPVFDSKGPEAQTWYRKTMTRFAELRVMAGVGI